MSTYAGLTRLSQAAKDLKAQWEETRAAWHDENAQRFEDDCVLPLLASARRVELSLSHLASVLQEMRRACE